MLRRMRFGSINFCGKSSINFFSLVWHVKPGEELAQGEKISIVIADDHDLVRRGLQLILSIYPEFMTIAEVSDGNEAVLKAKLLHPDVFIMDLNMPNLNGIEATRLIKRESKEIKVLIVSAYDDEHYVLQTYRCGADGYLLKSSTPEEFRKALNSIYKSSQFMCPHLSELQLKNLLHPISNPLNPAIDLLTAREREIIQLIAESNSHQQIADKLHISVRTVDTHHNNILHKLELHDTVSLVTFAIKNSLVVFSKKI